MNDLDGKVALVTGANTGIGRVTAEVLARRGARVWLAGRSEARTLPVVEALQAETAPDRAVYLPLDLGDFASIRAAAEAVLAVDEPLHLLINNAGVAGHPGVTASGFEQTFGVNHVGHFLLTALLRERLVASAPARVVNVSSRKHRDATTIDWEAVRQKTATITGLQEYAVSKLANILFTRELGRRLAGTGVTTYALHPGVVGTDVFRRVPWPFEWLLKKFMLTPEEGAQTTLYCATEPSLAEASGRYYSDCQETPPTPAAQNDALAAELWRRSEAWVSA